MKEIPTTMQSEETVLPERPTPFSRKRILIGLSVALGLVMLGMLWFVMQQSEATKKVVQNPSPSVQVASVWKSLPASATLSMQQQSAHAINIILHDTNVSISGVQFVISYDPKVLHNVKIAPGNLFANSRVLLENINTVNGSVTYALAIKEHTREVTGNGIVAILSFAMSNPYAQTTTELGFTQDTKVTTEKADNSILKETFGITIPIK